MLLIFLFFHTDLRVARTNKTPDSAPGPVRHAQDQRHRPYAPPGGGAEARPAPSQFRFQRHAGAAGRPAHQQPTAQSERPGPRPDPTESEPRPEQPQESHAHLIAGQ